MTFGQKLATHIAPIFLRLALGVVFLWAGLGKLIPEDYQVTPQNARALVDMGAVEASRVQGYLGADPDADQLEEDAGQPPPGDTGPDEAGDGDAGGDPEEGGGGSASLDHAIVLAQDADADDDLPELKRLFGVAVMVSQASRSTTDDAGNVRKGLLPGFMGRGETPKYLGWATAITEVFAGGFLIIGFMVRLCGLAVACIMAMALWITQIGPATVGTVDSVLGFIPAPGKGHTYFDAEVYTTLGWQLTLFAAGLTLLFSGAGTLSLDRILFGSSKHDDFDDD